jgi:hypothetical protein
MSEMFHTHTEPQAKLQSNIIIFMNIQDYNFVCGSVQQSNRVKSDHGFCNRLHKDGQNNNISEGTGYERIVLYVVQSQMQYFGKKDWRI